MEGRAAPAEQHRRATRVGSHFGELEQGAQFSQLPSHPQQQEQQPTQQQHLLQQVQVPQEQPQQHPQQQKRHAPTQYLQQQQLHAQHQPLQLHLQQQRPHPQQHLHKHPLQQSQQHLHQQQPLQQQQQQPLQQQRPLQQQHQQQQQPVEPHTHQQHVLQQYAQGGGCLNPQYATQQPYQKQQVSVQPSLQPHYQQQQQRAVQPPQLQQTFLQRQQQQSLHRPRHQLLDPQQPSHEPLQPLFVLQQQQRTEQHHLQQSVRHQPTQQQHHTQQQQYPQHQQKHLQQQNLQQPQRQHLHPQQAGEQPTHHSQQRQADQQHEQHQQRPEEHLQRQQQEEQLQPGRVEELHEARFFGNRCERTVAPAAATLIEERAVRASKDQLLSHTEGTGECLVGAAARVLSSGAAAAAAASPGTAAPGEAVDVVADVEKTEKTAPTAASSVLPNKEVDAGELGDKGRIPGAAAAAGACEEEDDVLLDVEKTDAAAAGGAAQSRGLLHTLVRCPAAERRQREERLLQPLTKQQRRQFTARLSASARALQRWVDCVRSKAGNTRAAAVETDPQDSTAAAAGAAAIEQLRETLLLLPPVSLFAGLKPLNVYNRAGTPSAGSGSAESAATEDADDEGDIHFHALPTETAPAADPEVSATPSSPRAPAWTSPAAASRGRPSDAAAAAAAERRYRVAEECLSDVSTEEDTLLDEVFPFGPADAYSILYTGSVDSEKAEEIVACLTSRRDRNQSHDSLGVAVSACNVRRPNTSKTSGSSRNSSKKTSGGDGFAGLNTQLLQRHSRDGTPAAPESNGIEEVSFPQTAFPLSSESAIAVREALLAQKRWLPWQLPPGLDEAHAAAWIREHLRLQRCAAREWRSLRLWTLEHAAAAAPLTADSAFDDTAGASTNMADSVLRAAAATAVPPPAALAASGCGEVDGSRCGVRSGEGEGLGTTFTPASKAELQWLRQERLQTWRRMERKRRNLQDLLLEDSKKRQLATQQHLLREVLTAKRRRQDSLFFVVA